MNILDILKEDIKDRTRSIENLKYNLHEELKYLEENLYELDNDSILNYTKRFEFKANHIIENTVILWVLENYRVLLKEEQKLDDGEVHRMKHKVTCNEDKPLTLCIVKDGEVQKEVTVNTDEFIQIMHEQAEDENYKEE